MILDALEKTGRRTGSARAAAGPSTVSVDDYRLLKGRLCAFLDLLRIGVVFERAEGDYLYYKHEGREVEILDLAGGYGSLLLGHNNPELVEEAVLTLSSGRPVHSQGSRREFSGRLARELCRRAGGEFRVVLANSGTEAVEAAMKHAMLETGSRTFIALEGGFHGKTLGALQLTSNPEYRAPFEIGGLRVLRVRPNDFEHLEETFQDLDSAAGFVFEPIQGEGGIHPLDPLFLRRAAELCTARGIPLIADEVQTGMGRTGTFLACDSLGIRPDYITLSKALGGGLAKVSALLIRQERYDDHFDRCHTSTYAEDDFSSAVALKTLELIDDAVLARCRSLGMQILSELHSLKTRYPDIIADVRGRGLMIGLEFHRLSRSSSAFMRLMTAEKDLVSMLMGHYFHAHRIRVAPTLSDPFTIRLEPSVHLQPSEVTRFVSATEEICRKLRSGDALGLTSYFLTSGPRAHEDIRVGESTGTVLYYDEARFRERESEVRVDRIGWLCHLIDSDDILTFGRDFAALPKDRREDYLRHMAPAVKPVVMNSVPVRAIRGASVQLHAIMIPVTSREIKRWMDNGEVHRAQELVGESVEIARALGCKLVSLGQYTSIVTRNGTDLRVDGVGLTTGNHYTVVLAIQALERAMRQSGVDPLESTLAVVGAAGNIGRACATLLAPQVRRLLLLGSNRPNSRERLLELSAQFPNAEIVEEPYMLRTADVVVAASNAVEAKLGPEHFARNAIVCDLSVPAAVRPETRAARPDVQIVLGGIARLPYGEDLEIAGFPLPGGQTYACMAEGLLLGFERKYDTTYVGPVDAERVRTIGLIAAKHGFGLAEVKRDAVI